MKKLVTIRSAEAGVPPPCPRAPRFAMPEDRHRETRVRFHGVALAAIGLAALASGVVWGVDSRGDLARSVEQAALEIARAQVAPPDRFEIGSVRFGGASRTAPDATVELVLAAVTGPNGSGIVGVRLHMLAAGVPVGEARATVRGRVRGPALEAARTLAGGQVPTAGSVEVVDCDLTRLGETPLRTLAELDDRVPVRTLGAGRVLAPSLFAPAPRVRRGDVVDVEYASERLSIVASAVALGDGAVGEVVPLENRASGTVVSGRVLGDGTVRVERVRGNR